MRDREAWDRYNAHVNPHGRPRLGTRRETWSLTPLEILSTGGEVHLGRGPDARVDG